MAASMPLGHGGGDVDRRNADEILQLVAAETKVFVIGRSKVAARRVSTSWVDGCSSSPGAPAHWRTGTNSRLGGMKMCNFYANAVI